MNVQEINRAIAERCGTVLSITHHDGGHGGGSWKEDPDYYNDLNAMHEAEKRVKDVVEYGRNSYGYVLDSVCRIAHSETYHATATQRAEAFLRTIGKWKESRS